MPIDFCQALKENQIDTIKAIVDKKLKDVYTLNNDNTTFNLLKDWLEDQYCIEKVEITPGVFRSEPPIKELIIFLKFSVNDERKMKLHVTLYPGNYKMD